MKSFNVLLLLFLFFSFVCSLKRLTIFTSPRNIGYVYPDLGEYNFAQTNSKATKNLNEKVACTNGKCGCACQNGKCGC